jgi:geranylgeranyl diphosphate synthase type II
MPSAAAIELMHCASLVHDDLPCFDNADTRRGQPSVHKAFGERLAVLAGDALIVLAYQTLSAEIHHRPERAKVLLRGLSQAVGMPEALLPDKLGKANRWWICASTSALRPVRFLLRRPHSGAASAGEAPAAWEALGNWLGEAYQVADDIRDVAADAAELGKPVGQDLCHGRPSAVTTLGLSGALERFNHLMGEALGKYSGLSREKALRALLRAESQRLIPSHMLGKPQGGKQVNPRREALPSSI